MTVINSWIHSFLRHALLFNHGEIRKFILPCVDYLQAVKSVSWNTVTEVLKMLTEAASRGQAFSSPKLRYRNFTMVSTNYSNNLAKMQNNKFSLVRLVVSPSCRAESNYVVPNWFDSDAELLSCRTEIDWFGTTRARHCQSNRIKYTRFGTGIVSLAAVRFSKRTNGYEGD